MNNKEAIDILEVLATNMVGSLIERTINGDNTKFVDKCIEAIDLAQSALRERERRSDGVA